MKAYLGERGRMSADLRGLTGFAPLVYGERDKLVGHLACSPLMGYRPCDDAPGPGVPQECGELTEFAPLV